MTRQDDAKLAAAARHGCRRMDLVELPQLQHETRVQARMT
jgi:hypothetical protein